MPTKQPKSTKKQKPKADVKLQELEAQAAEYLAGWKRAQADYKNLQVQTTKEKEALALYIKAQVLSEFFPIIDHFNLALDHIPEDAKQASWAQGLMYLQTQFQKTLEEMGVTRIETAGKMFDHDAMEAVEQQTSKEYASGQVIKEVRAGYKIGDTIIAPAKVIVAE